LLNGIKGGLQMASNRLQMEDINKAQKMLDLSLKSAIEAEDLVAKIALSGKIKTQQLLTIEIENLFQEMTDNFQAGLSSDINFSIAMVDNLPKIKADPDLLKACINALLDNAKEAISEKELDNQEHREASIDFQASVLDPINQLCSVCHKPIHNQQLQITISNSGEQINSEILDAIYEPFFTTKKSSQQVANTTGLGLTLVRSVIHNHDGHLLVESNQQKTSFTILLPVVE